MRNKGWYGSFSSKGTLLRDRIVSEVSIDKEIEVTYNKYTLVYRLVRKHMRVKQSQCPHCEEWIDETENYLGQYYIKEIWIGKHLYTERFMEGGDLSKKAYENRLRELSVSSEETESAPTYVS